METVEYKNVSFTVWDVGGQDKVQNSCVDICNCRHLVKNLPTISAHLHVIQCFFFFFFFFNWKSLLFRGIHLLTWKTSSSLFLSFFLTLDHVDSTIMETLLPEHPGPYICGG